MINMCVYVICRETGERIKRNIKNYYNKCNLQDINVNVKENILQVTAYGQGARGLNNYTFSLNLHSSIDPNVY